MKKLVFVVTLIALPLMLRAQQMPYAPEFRTPATLTGWEHQGNEIRQNLSKLFGSIPEIPSSIKPRIISREERKGFTIEYFEFDNGADAKVYGYFLVPMNVKLPVPAVYYCHWHGGNYDLGKQEIFTTHHTPEVPAEALTRLGYAVMAIDAYCFGERSGKGPGGSDERGSAEELSTSKRELWLGRSLWAMMVRDDMIALNYLFARPEVDTTRVAVTGISMGATRSWWLMALDDRIRTGVAVGCLTRYQDLIAEGKLKAHGIYYFLPGILNHFDTEAVISLIAPRPVLFMTGDQDIGSPVSGINTIDKKVRPIFELYGKSDAFINIIYPNTGHVYTPDMWNKMKMWMQQNLK